MIARQRPGQKAAKRPARAWARAAASLVPAVAGLSIATPAGAAAQVAFGRDAPELEARVWLDRGAEPLLHTGDQVRLYYGANDDAYVAIFHIDTDGTASLVFPRSPDDDYYVRGGRDYRLLFPRSPYWYVDDEPGLGYFFIVASPDPFDFSRFRYSRFDLGWDLELVGRQVYRDPYVAMDDYVAALLPDWESAPYALDFVSYHVGTRHQYPRFLCYDCHGFRSYAAWNPYYASCTDFRVVIYDDPYFYPARRYRADRVVWARPAPGLHRFGFKERASGEPAVPLRQPRSVMDMPGVVAPAPRRSPAGGAGGVPSEVRTPSRVPADAGRSRVVPAPTQPTDGRRGVGRPSERTRGGSAPGVVAPPRSAADPAAEAPGQPSGAVSAPEADPRQRPVLRRRPSEPSGTDPEPRRDPSSTAPRARPREESPRAPSSAPSGEREPAVSRPSEPGVRSGGEAPTVRSSPEGRPAVRR